MKRNHILMVLAVLVVVVGVFFYLVKPFKVPSTVSQPAAGAMVNPSLPGAPGIAATTGGAATAPGGDAASDMPAWSRDRSKLGTATAVSPRGNAQNPEKQAAFDAMQRLLSTQDADPVKLAAAIAQLEKANGSPVYHGIRLDVLRQSLEISKKMMVLGEELRVLTESRIKAGVNGNPELEAAIKTKQAQMNTLTNQMATSALIQPMPAPASSK